MKKLLVCFIIAFVCNISALICDQIERAKFEARVKTLEYRLATLQTNSLLALKLLSHDNGKWYFVAPGHVSSLPDGKGSIIAFNGDTMTNDRSLSSKYGKAIKFRPSDAYDEYPVVGGLLAYSFD
jgi:hypothetical protein